MEEAIHNPSILYFCLCKPKIWYNETKHEMLTNKVCIQYQTKIILL